MHVITDTRPSPAPTMAAAALNAADNLGKLIAGLPEVYQPIFGHPELSARASRSCEDRLACIISIYEALEAKLGRPLRVLDLGCAQGFFSLSLAKLGATVTGIDFQIPNIPVCNALAAEHPNLKARFQLDLVEDVIARLEPGQYDLVLGLSLFHHLAHRYGIAAVQKLLAALAKKTIAGVYEMALACEPLDWAASQPQNPRDLLQGYAFVHEFARHRSHLFATWRPLFVASNQYWFLNNHAEAFHSWKSESHSFAGKTNKGTRRYFFGHGHMVKLFTLNDAELRDVNLKEHANETAFLTAPPPGLNVPQLFLYGQHQNEAWLARQTLPGELLLDIIRAKQPYDAKRVIGDTLEQLSALEAAGLYHNDLRTSNIVITPDGSAKLIDYGAISGDKKDRGWPYNIFLSFMIYMLDVVSGNVTISNTIRSEAFNPESFPDPYRYMLWRLFERSPDEWSFAFMRACFSQSQKEELSVPAPMRLSLMTVMQTMENACKIHQSAAVYWHQSIKAGLPPEGLDFKPYGRDPALPVHEQRA